MPKVDLAFAFKQSPEKAVAYFKSLGLKVHDDWKPIEYNARQKAFMVANVGKEDVLKDIYSEVGKYIEGGSMRDAKKNLERILTEKGWWGAGHVLDADGVSVGRKLNPRRVDIILRQNKISAFSAARYEKLMASRATRPLWRLNTRLDNKVRPSHRSLHGLIFPVDDPFWDSFYPPIDWLCRCFVTCHSARDIEREGWQDDLRDSIADASLKTWVKRYSTRLREERSADVVTYTDPKRMDFEARVPSKVTTGIGFANNPAKDWLLIFTPEGGLNSLGLKDLADLIPPKPLIYTLDELPVRTVDSQLIMQKGLDEIEYVKAFLAEFGATLDKGVVFRDAAGNGLPIGVDLFKNRGTGELKASKFGRGPYLKLLADVIKKPEEIWLNWELINGQPQLVANYVKLFDVSGLEGGFAVFKLSRDGWYGATLFNPKTGKTDSAKRAYLNAQRMGFRLYKR